MLFAFLSYMIPLGFIAVVYWAFKKMMPYTCNDVTDKLMIVGSAMWVIFALAMVFAKFAGTA